MMNRLGQIVLFKKARVLGAESPRRETLRGTKKTITLRWKYAEKGVTKFLIYRAVNDEPMSLYKSVPGNSFSMKDVNLRMGFGYSYRVKVAFKDGVESEFSKEIKLTY